MWLPGLEASLPSPGVISRLYFAVDTGRVFMDTGTGWIRLNLSPRGAYSGSVTYQDKDLVQYNGQVWRALQTVTGVTPVEGSFWTLFLDKGATGATGAQGIQGVQGIQGIQGTAGTNGVNAYTTTSANFTQPATSSNVSVSVGSTAWMGTWQTIYVAGGGYYSISSITNSTTVVLTNVGYPGNSASGAIISSGAAVSPGGLIGPSGGVPATRLVSTTAPLAGGGDLSADRTLSVSTGTTGSTVAIGNDSRIVNAVQKDGSIAMTGLLTLSGDATAALNPVSLQQNQALAFKHYARAASTANVTVSNPGTSTFDGVTLSSGDTVLLKNQTAGAENGTYTFNGSASALTRRPQADTSAKIQNGFVVYVNEGSTNQGTWAMTTTGTITLGTTALTFARTVQAGTGLTQTNQTIAANIGTGAGQVAAGAHASQHNPSGADVIQRFNTIYWTFKGTLTTTTAAAGLRVPIWVPSGSNTPTLVSAAATVLTAPTTQSIIFDLSKSAAGTGTLTTVWTGGTNRLAITATNTTANTTTFDVSTFSSLDTFTVNIAQVGSGTAGADATFALTYRY